MTPLKIEFPMELLRAPHENDYKDIDSPDGMGSKPEG